MKYLHFPVHAHVGSVVEVTLDHAANIRLLDEANFSRYRRGQRHHYRGGHMAQSPVHLTVPHAGSWHVVVDLGGYAGHVSASVAVRRAA